MATVYSLVCFGGRLGKTVTFTDTGDVVNLTAHGLYPGTGVVFSNSGGALPTGVTAGTTYYAKQGADVNKFLLYPTSADAIAGTNQVTFTGTGSGTNTVKSAWLLSLSDLSRWGDSGSERIYDGLVSWNSGRSAASNLNAEICELGEAFTETSTSAVLINIPGAVIEINSTINGVRTSAFHNGIVGSGFVLYMSLASASYALKSSIESARYEGFTVKVASGFYGTHGLFLEKFGQSVHRMVVFGPGGYTSIGTQGTGIGVNGQGTKVIQCLSFGWGTGIYIVQYLTGILCADNFITKCGIGMRPAGATNLYGYFYGNISVGNTTNWGTSAGFNAATQNFGLTGEAWIAGSGTRGVIATTDFLDYANADFSPALSSSPQVETGADYYTAPVLDISDAVRPSYMNGAAAYRDAGPYEFDQGYGPWPASYTLELTGVPAGSEVRCYTGAKGASAVEIGGTETTTGTSYSFSHSSGGVAGFIHIIHPDYAIQQFDYTYQAADTTIPIQMPADRWYSNPA